VELKKRKPVYSDMPSSLLFYLLLIIPSQIEDLQAEYDFINWYLSTHQIEGKKVFLASNSSDLYSKEVWLGKKEDGTDIKVKAIDYRHLSNRWLFPWFKPEDKIASDLLSGEEIDRMREDSEEIITFQRRLLDKRIILMSRDDYEHGYTDDAKNGYYILGKPLFNDDKSICIMYVSHVHTNQYSTDGLSVFQKTDGEWKEVMGYVGWVN
jgi:hypothetical protein